jgi:hypothetical protein
MVSQALANDYPLQHGLVIHKIAQTVMHGAACVAERFPEILHNQRILSLLVGVESGYDFGGFCIDYGSVSIP